MSQHLSLIVDREAPSGDYRFERKFRTTLACREELVDRILTHPGLYKEHHPDRQINSIYFDTTDLQFMSDNLAGISRRKKPRIRWYGRDIFRVENPYLELKIKHNMLGRKDRFEVGGFSIRAQSFYSELTSSLNALILSNPELNFMRSLEPTLFVTYSRSYYLSANGEYRITVDSELNYARVTRLGPIGIMNRQPTNDVVVEVKYGVNASDQEAMLNSLGLRFARCSKYVIGMLTV